MEGGENPCSDYQKAHSTSDTNTKLNLYSPLYSLRQ